MSFNYSCECGYSLPISAASAGATVSCRCGRPVKIPKLSELKRLSGQPVEPLIGIADRLRTMYLDKRLPPETHCIICQVKTASTLECWVECERARTGAPGSGQTIVKTILLNAILPFFGFVYIPLGAGMSADAEPYGNDLVVRTPLPICENCQFTTSRSPGNIRHLLQSVGLYRQLLETYPGARVGSTES